MERLGRDNLLKTQNDGIRHKVQYKKRRCFTHRQAFTTRNKNKVANSPWVASVWFPQTKAIGWSFQCTAQTVVRKQRQYGGGAPMANVSQLKIMANSDRQSPWKLGHLSRGCAAALPSSVLRRCLCCRFQRSSAPGQGRMVPLGCRLCAAPGLCRCSATRGSRATASPQHRVPQSVPGRSPQVLC